MPGLTYGRIKVIFYVYMEHITTDRKTGLMYRRWQADKPKAVFVLVHGLGAQSGRWEFLAEFFLRRNISSYALELRGFGETRDLKGHVDSFDVYFDDIRRLHDIAKENNPGKKLFLIGQSLGGLICFLMGASDADLFNGVVCITPALSNRLKFGFINYIKLFLSLFYNPTKRFSLPFTTEMCTRDVDYQKVLDSDSREIRFATAKLLQNTMFSQVKAAMVRKKVKCPILFLLAGKDQLVDSTYNRKIFELLEEKDKKVIEYADMHHALNVDLGRENVFEDIWQWIGGHL